MGFWQLTSMLVRYFVCRRHHVILSLVPKELFESNRLAILAGQLCMMMSQLFYDWPIFPRFTNVNDDVFSVYSNTFSSANARKIVFLQQ